MLVGEGGWQQCGRIGSLPGATGAVQLTICSASYVGGGECREPYIVIKKVIMTHFQVVITEPEVGHNCFFMYYNIFPLHPSSLS